MGDLLEMSNFNMTCLIERHMNAFLELGELVDVTKEFIHIRSRETKIYNLNFAQVLFLLTLGGHKGKRDMIKVRMVQELEEIFTTKEAIYDLI